MPIPAYLAAVQAEGTRSSVADRATIGTARELARRLADQARRVRALIADILQHASEPGGLHEQYQAFKHALRPGLTPNEFADMYAQTLAYGLFAARAAQPNTHDFSRASAARLLPKTNPFLCRLFDELAGSDLDDRIAWAVDDIALLLARADMAAVLHNFKDTRREDPVVHFYETFLAAYDLRLRERRGVYYTPAPVVSFIVRSVDHVLRECFGRSLGLADPDTLILDPAAGTATFLAFVIEHIYTLLQRSDQAGGWDSYVGAGKKSLLRRLTGYELLMAPYAIAHITLGRLLQKRGYNFHEDDCLGIFMTNALDRILSQAHENNAAPAGQIMIVLGNPPYAATSANTGQSIDELVRTSYYPNDARKEHNPKLLLDDYVKFIRFGQWRIEQTGAGVLAFISNHGYLDNPTFRGMRRELLRAFTDIFILNLHGNSKRQERGPDGTPDENVFDIQQGVAIGIFVKQPGELGPVRVHYADLWGVRETHDGRSGKYPWLASNDISSVEWTAVVPQAPFYQFIPQAGGLAEEYRRGWPVNEIFPLTATGIKTHRDHFALDFEQYALEQRIAEFRDETLTNEHIRQTYALPDTRDWKLDRRRHALGADREWRRSFGACLYRPFDIRAIFYHPNVIELPRAEVMEQMRAGANIALVTTRQVTSLDFCHVLCADLPIEMKTCSHDRGTNLFPLYRYPAADGSRRARQARLFEAETGEAPGGRSVNLNPAFIREVEARLGLHFIADGRGDLCGTFGPEDIFHYTYAILHSPAYRRRYAELLKSEFARLPLVRDAALFVGLAALGAALVDVHLLRLPGANPGAAGGAGGAEALLHPRAGFPVDGSNIVERVDYQADTGQVLINRTQYFDVIEPATWALRIGGYQVLDKWLKDRKRRALDFDDLLRYRRIIVALDETRRIMAAIDRRIPGWPVDE